MKWWRIKYVLQHPVKFIRMKMNQRNRKKYKIRDRYLRLKPFIGNDNPDLWKMIELYFDEEFQELVFQIQNGNISFDGYRGLFSVERYYRDKKMLVLIQNWNIIFNLLHLLRNTGFRK